MSVLKILWIEEEADDTLVEFKTYFILGGYTLDVTHSSSEAVSKLFSNKYDLIILDIRIIPGDDEKWINLHIKGEKRLGLVLLQEVISQNEELKSRTIIFTNENLADVKNILRECEFPMHKFLRKRDVKIPEQLEAFIKRLG